MSELDWKAKLGIKLARSGGVDLRPWDASLDYAKTQIESLTLALDALRKKYHEAVEARLRAEKAIRGLMEGKEIIAPGEVWTLVPAARDIIAWTDGAAPGTSGEYKRHQTLAELRKRFPQARERDVSLAIELALRDGDVAT